VSIFKRRREATAEQIAATGAAGWGVDANDPDAQGLAGYRGGGGSGGRAVPTWTIERARTYSVAAYRSNPMARAIIDTYGAFCVGDSGVSLEVSHPEVRDVAERFWSDPRVDLGSRQELALRSHMLMGESLYEMMSGGVTGITRYSPIDTSRVLDVVNDRGNVLWPAAVILRGPNFGEDIELDVAQADEFTGLMTGTALWWPSWKTLETDKRGTPFLMPVLDWLDSYDQVLSNLIDRTALARYMVWDVTLKGADQSQIDQFIASRGGRAAPRSGTIEVHNDSVEWSSKSAQSGTYEDKTTAGSVLTLVAGGAGLARTWLADPEDANRATSNSMAEPIRRRVGAVQNVWLRRQTEMVRYAVDQAVGAGRLPATVTVESDGGPVERTPAECVTVRGPQIAAADAQVMARVMANLSTGLEQLRRIGALTPDAAEVAAKKAWEDYMGVPYRSELGKADGNLDDAATAIDETPGAGKALMDLLMGAPS
jgi:hypothetical protein